VLVTPSKKMSGSKGKRHGEIQCSRSSNPEKVKTRRRTDIFWGLTQKRKHTHTMKKRTDSRRSMQKNTHQRQNNNTKGNKRQRGTHKQRETERERRKRKKRTGSHLSRMDPRVEMAFFTLSTFPAENLNTGETDDCLGNSIFSRVSFLSCT